MTPAALQRHRETSRASMRELRAIRKAAGHCARCTKPRAVRNGVQKTLCEEHMVTQAAWANGMYAARKAAGVCRDCTAPCDIRQNGTRGVRCDICAELHCESVKAWKAKRKARKEAA